jgi:hypothetical protein
MIPGNRGGNQLNVSPDYIRREQLPRVRDVAPTHDFAPLHDILRSKTSLSDEPIGVDEIEAARPSETVFGIDSFGINFRALYDAAQANPDMHQKSAFQIRMGNSQNQYRDDQLAVGVPLAEIVDFVVDVLGYDASLLYHGPESASRAVDVVAQQQLLHLYVFHALHATHGNTRATTDLYKSFGEQVKPVSFVVAKYAVLGAFLHDYGEPFYKGDKRLSQKLLTGNPEIDASRIRDAEFEQGYCVTVANELHTKGTTGQRRLAAERYESQRNPDPARLAKIHRRAGMTLDSREISDASYGTEIKQPIGTVPLNADIFNANELREYVDSGNHTHDAVIHNIGDVHGKDLAQMLAAFSVDTIANNLAPILPYA